MRHSLFFFVHFFKKVAELKDFVDKNSYRLVYVPDIIGVGTVDHPIWIYVPVNGHPIQKRHLGNFSSFFVLLFRQIKEVLWISKIIQVLKRILCLVLSHPKWRKWGWCFVNGRAFAQCRFHFYHHLHFDNLTNLFFHLLLFVLFDLLL